jgi:hypothetical protein
MTGFELYHKLKEIDSKVKVCYITAFEILRKVQGESFFL